VASWPGAPPCSSLLRKASADSSIDIVVWGHCVARKDIMWWAGCLVHFETQQLIFKIFEVFFFNNAVSRFFKCFFK
jgi:hypothetical protein